MHKNGPPPPYEPPLSVPPSYSQTVGGIPSASAFTPAETYVAGPTIVTMGHFGPQSLHTICPYCHAEIVTATSTSPGVIAYIFGGVIALMGCWLGCCLIPCCIDECMDVSHSCPSCKAYLGRYRR